MNKWLKIGGIFVIVTVVTIIAVNVAAFAQGTRGFREGPPFGFRSDGFAGPMREGFGGDFSSHGPGRGRGLGGEVTAVGDSSLTIQTRNDETVVVNVSDETRVMLAETQSEGSLGDIKVGSTVGIRGSRNEDGSVDARGIVVRPEGDSAGGRVTAVDATTISVENRDGEATIVTNADTQFRLGREGAGSLADVTPDKFVMAFGETQADGSLAARLVIVGDKGPGRGPQQGLGAGEVTAIDGTTFTLNTFRGDELTVLTDDTTQYRTRSGEEVSFEDIEVGKMVIIKGEPVEGQENTVQATVIGIKTE